jgi:uncharacterized protein (TIGR00369 family)
MIDNMTAASVPPGFDRHFRNSPVTDPWEPIYSKRDGDALTIGLLLAQPHTNSRGMVHGGVIAALADNAMGLNCGLRFPELQSLVTISLAIDYLGAAAIGQWLQIDINFVKIGGSICFAQCLVTADGTPCARGNATFKVLKDKART